MNPVHMQVEVEGHRAYLPYVSGSAATIGQILMNRHVQIIFKPIRKIDQMLPQQKTRYLFRVM